MYNYIVYNIRISSSFALPLIRLEEELDPDLTIVFGSIEKSVEKPLFMLNGCAYSEKQALIHIDGVADFFAENGTSIIVELLDGVEVDEQVLAQYTINNVMTMILLQRSIHPMHGSGLNIRGRGIAISGDAGVGKSSLSHTLIENGYEIMTDDLIGIEVSEMPIMLHYGPLIQRFTEESIDWFKLDQAKLNEIHNLDGKRMMILEQPHSKEAVPLVMMIVLKTGNVEFPVLNRIDGAQKLEVVMKHTYRELLFRFRSLIARVFGHSSIVANNIEIYELIRPVEGYTTEAQMNLILNQLEEIKVYG